MSRTTAVRLCESIVSAPLLLGFLGGCTATSPDGPRARQTSDSLTAPVTVTLSVANPLSPISPVVTGVNAVSLGSNSQVLSGTVAAMGSGGLTVQPDATLSGDAWSRGTAALGDRVAVKGTVHATNVTLGNGTTVHARDSAPAFDPPSTLSWRVIYPSGTALNYTLNADQTLTLAPGVYGSISLNSQSTLNLSSGTYYVQSFAMANSRAVVRLNQSAGPVIIYALTGLTLNSGSFVVADASDAGAQQPDVLIGYLGTSAISVNTVFDGALIAPFAQLTLNATQAVYTGYYYGQSVIAQSNVQFRYAPPVAAVTASAVPGSRCASLLNGIIPAQDVARYCPTCGAPEDSDYDGVPNCLDGCPYDALKTSPGVCGCGKSDVDSDHDGVPDCVDQCPNDPNNTYPGQCGCSGSKVFPLAAAGTPCTDTACPQAGATCNGAGVCGNRSACAPASGCSYVSYYGVGYWLCGEPTPWSGAPDAAAPVPNGLATQAAAQSACSAKGLTLTRIDSLSQNQRIGRLLSAPLWLGANEISSSGTWRWSAPGTNNGDIFWSGGPTGSATSGRFAYWAPGAPGSQSCAVLDPANYGKWSDVSCSDSAGYICQYTTPLAPPVFHPPPGSVAQPSPWDGGCVPEFQVDAGGLPDSSQELLNEIDAAYHDVYVGAATPPPPGSTCPSDLDFEAEALSLDNGSGAGCTFQKATVPDGAVVPCMTNSDCLAEAGPNFPFCRQAKADTGCHPDGSFGQPVPGATCPGQGVCVAIQCPMDDAALCGQVQLCSVPEASVDAGLDPGSHVDATAFNPATMFGGMLPDASPAPSYNDPWDAGTGPNHPWCWMVPQDQVPAASQPDTNKHGSSGHGSSIQFQFTPNLVFNADPKPAALFEHGLDVNARAGLRATVLLKNFMGQDYQADILNAQASFEAHRCSVDDSQTQFEVFGLDFLSLTGFNIPHFDTSAPSDPLYQYTKGCNDAFNDFLLWANRAKKAFRDAQQLLSQYHNASSVGGLANDLCHDIMSTVGTDDVPFFPGGLQCYDNEPVEVTINRFLDYLQAPGYGQLSQLEDAITKLGNVTQNLENQLAQKARLQLDINPSPQQEDQTVLEVQFAIGPVPMVLEVDAFASYGIEGQLLAELNFPNFNASSPVTPSQGQSQQIDNKVADVQVTVGPYASAGLSVFLGAGVSLGPFEASLGIEGQVTLAEIHAPIFGGAGVTLTVTNDLRPIPKDIAPPVSAIGPAIAQDVLGNTINSVFHFGIPTAAQIGIYYRFGAGLDLDHVLSGELDARLRIRFFFFSKTWRKLIVHYDGWTAHYDLVSQAQLPLGSIGSSGPQAVPHSNAGVKASTNVTEGETPAGMNEAQLPLTTLAYLTPPDAGPAPIDAGDAGDAGDAALGPDGVPLVPVAFDKTALQTFFYDDLCCAKLDAGCSVHGTPACCPNEFCFVPDGGPDDAGTCMPQCKVQGAPCQANGTACCGGLVCDSTGTCQPPCAAVGQQCSTSVPCCASVVGGTCAGSTCCVSSGNPCTQASDCCTGTCSGAPATCQTPPPIVR